MDRKKDVLMVFDFLIELLKEKEIVSDKTNIIEETKAESIAKEAFDTGKTNLKSNDFHGYGDFNSNEFHEEKTDETFDLAANLRHASMLMKRIEEKDREQANTQNLLSKQKKEFEEEIKRLKDINREKNMEQRDEESKELLTEKVPIGEFTNQYPKIIFDEEVKKNEKNNVV